MSGAPDPGVELVGGVVLAVVFESYSNIPGSIRDNTDFTVYIYSRFWFASNVMCV